MKEGIVVLKYTIARFALFGVCYGVLWLVGMRSPDQVLWLLVAAALLSMVLSIFVLKPLRDQASDRINERVAKSLAAHEARKHLPPTQDEAAEDAEADSADSTP